MRRGRPALFREAATMYRERGEFPLAAEFLRRVVWKDPRDVASWAWLGYSYLMMDDVHNSRIAYQQTLYLSPDIDDPYVWYGLGLLYERSQHHEAAVRELCLPPRWVTTHGPCAVLCV